MVSGSALLVRDSCPVQARGCLLYSPRRDFSLLTRLHSEKCLFHNSDKRAMALGAASQSGAILDDPTAYGAVHKQSQQQLLPGLSLVPAAMAGENLWLGRCLCQHSEPYRSGDRCGLSHYCASFRQGCKQ